MRRLTKRLLIAALLGTASAASSAGTIAYEVPTGTDGNQSYDGVLGMDFIVNSAIRITHLGVFDDDSDGLALAITGELWSRNDNGTANNPFDDTSGDKLFSHVFSGSNETLIGGSRFLELANPLLLAAGAYTVVAHGYGTEENGNARVAGGGGDTPVWTTNDGGGLLDFVGCARFGGTEGATIGDIVDTSGGCGPVNRYAAGTFQFTADVPAPGAFGLLLGVLGMLLARRRP